MRSSYGGGLLISNLFDDALAARATDLNDVKIRSAIVLKPLGKPMSIA